MKIQIREGGKSHYVEVSFPSILKAWFLAWLSFTSVIVVVGLLLVLILE